jgi:hypothetical protein
MPFYFPPSPFDGATVRNSVSGIVYTYRDAFESWIIEGGGGGNGTPNVISENPPTPVDEFPAGSIWYKPSAQQLYIQNNGAWEICAPSVVEFTSLDTRVDVNETILNNEVAHRISGDEALRVKVQDTAPTDPIPNLSLWFDSTDLELLLYYNDGDSSQWVPCSIPLAQTPEFVRLQTEVQELKPLAAAAEQLQAQLKAGDQRLMALESNPVPDVTKAYVDEADVALLQEVQTLKDRVNEIEKSTENGNWRLLLEGEAGQGDLLAYQQGFLGGVATWDQVAVLGFDLTDLGGVVHSCDEVAVGDVIRLKAGEISHAAFQITGIEAPGIYEVRLQSSKAEPIDRQDYKIDFLSGFDPSKFATLSFVTQQLNALAIRLSTLES